MKLAVTDLAAFIVTVHVAPLTASHPVHPLNSDTPVGVAVSVTAVPTTYASEQSEPQLIPAGLEVTVPLPRTTLLTAVVSVKRFRSKLAVTDFAAVMRTVHVAPDVELQPVQPTNTEFAAGEAVSVTDVLTT